MACVFVLFLNSSGGNSESLFTFGDIHDYRLWTITILHPDEVGTGPGEEIHLQIQWSGSPIMGVITPLSDRPEQHRLRFKIGGLRAKESKIEPVELSFRDK